MFAYQFGQVKVRVGSHLARYKLIKKDKFSFADGEESYWKSYLRRPIQTMMPGINACTGVAVSCGYDT